MTNFIWPSDADRADNDELDRVCEYLDLVMNDHEDLQKVAETHRLNSDINTAKLKNSIDRVAELEAHLEHIVGLLDGSIELSLDTAPDYDREISQWLADTPANSLARRDLLKQVQILDRVLLEYKGHVTICRSAIVNKAIQLRQQAEALNDRPT